MTAPQTRIQLCGQLQVELAGTRREADLRGRQGRLLFAFLVLHREHPIRRDELVEALWSQDGSPPSDTALAPVLSRLRSALAPAAIDGRDQLTLVLPEPVWIDVEAAGAALDRAREALRSGADDIAAAAAREAAELAEPGLLPGYDAPWLSEPRNALDDLRVEALEIAAEAGVRLGGPELPGAEAAARAAVAAAPYRESARARLIRALQARGNLAEALLAYEDVRTLLREELGTAPGPELLALHERLLNPEAAPARPPQPTAAAPPAPPAAPSDLVERERELAGLDALLAHALAGEGGLALLEGPAGIGKTRLLSEVEAHARAAGARVLLARAGMLERENGFGIARQLFEEVMGDDALFSDTAEPARAVLTGVDADAGGGDRSFAALHGLFRLASNLAAQRPLVICIDDLQWSDASSLRFVAYLARRLATLPVLVAVTVRTGEPATDEALLAEVAQDPLTVALRPVPLTAAATATLVRARLGDDADATFADACHEVTRGNPLLLRQLLAALASEQVTPDAEHAEQVRAIGPRAVSRTVLLRLARLPQPAVAVARAVAILGEQPGLPAAAALAGIDEAEAAQAAGTLALADILRPDEPLGFVHPLVRDAVYDELPAAQRGLEHLRAARLLADMGAGADQVAAQLLAAPARGDAWVVERLREAARVALVRGAPESAVAALERAMTEPPTAGQRAALALALGEAGQYVSGPAAVPYLREAYDGLTDPAARAEAAIALARLLLFVGAPKDGVDLAIRAAAELPPEFDDLHASLEAIELIGAFFGVLPVSELERLERVRRGPRGTGPGARSLTSLASLALAVGGGDAAEALALAREALEDDVLLTHEPGLFSVGATQVLALSEPAEGLAGANRMRQFAERRGSGLDSVGADLWGGLTMIWMGDLHGAEASLDRAVEGEILWGTTLSAEMGYSAGFTAVALLEQGDIARARAALERTDASDGGSDGARFWLIGKAELLIAEGRYDEAIAITEQIETTRPQDAHPVWSPWRTLRARALAASGQTEQAIALAADELELARRVGAPWVIGRGLRLLGTVEGSGGVAHLREAVALLEATSAGLEYAKALAALGDALAATGSADEAPAAWLEARELAERCGADGLARDMAARAQA